MGKTHDVNIIGIGHVGGLLNVLQPASATKPALLSVSHYLRCWPVSIIMLNSNEAKVYAIPDTIKKLTTTQIIEAQEHLEIILVFHKFKKSSWL
jgi:ACT domain-containing protein